MAAVWRRRSTNGADLVVLPPARVDGDAPTLPTRGDPPTWTRTVGVVSAAVAAVSLAVIAVAQWRQADVARHQQCIANAEAQAQLAQTSGEQAVALAKCFPGPTLPQVRFVTVPGVVTETLSQAELDLRAVGVKPLLAAGPSAPNSFVTDQTPAGGESVPAGTDVSLKTRPA
jgi:hypothetical protein